MTRIFSRLFQKTVFYIEEVPLSLKKEALTSGFIQTIGDETLNVTHCFII
jgi:hypothetical protein